MDIEEEIRKEEVLLELAEHLRREYPSDGTVKLQYQRHQAKSMDDERLPRRK